MAGRSTPRKRCAPSAGGTASEAPDILNGFTSLVDKNLVQVQSSSTAVGELRFRMLETAREFALTTLEASGEADTVRRRHAEYFATLAEQARLDCKALSNQR